jgi:hypothetical protein
MLAAPSGIERMPTRRQPGQAKGRPTCRCDSVEEDVTRRITFERVAVKGTNRSGSRSTQACAPKSFSSGQFVEAGTVSTLSYLAWPQPQIGLCLPTASRVEAGLAMSTTSYEADILKRHSARTANFPCARCCEIAVLRRRLLPESSDAYCPDRLRRGCLSTETRF